MCKNINEEEKMYRIPLFWKEDENLQSIYVNELWVTHRGPEFYIYFGELCWPAIIGNNEIPEKLEITTKARIVVSPEEMGKFIEALTSNYEKYKEKKRNEDQDS